MSYVGGTKRSGCVFCDALAADDDRDRLILHRGTRAFIILNLYPYNSGHSMVVPYDHVAALDDLDAETRAEILELATVASTASKRVLHCDGFNLGLNIGSVAGAGVADHLHMHVVPRWTGDANFMPILGNTMVMPELLPATYARLRAQIESDLGAHDGRPVDAAGAIVVAPGAGVVMPVVAGAPPFPTAPVDDETSSADAALQAVRDSLSIDAAIAGWAGGGESSFGRTVYFLMTAPESSLDASNARVVPVDGMHAELTDDGARALLADNTAILARLVEEGS